MWAAGVPFPSQEQASEILKQNKALLEKNKHLKLQRELLTDILTDTLQSCVLERKVQVSGWHHKTKKSAKLMMSES